jgi:hypothetical protein
MTAAFGDDDRALLAAIDYSLCVTTALATAAFECAAAGKCSQRPCLLWSSLVEPTLLRALCCYFFMFLVFYQNIGQNGRPGGREPSRSTVYPKIFPGPSLRSPRPPRFACRVRARRASGRTRRAAPAKKRNDATATACVPRRSVQVAKTTIWFRAKAFMQK